MECTHALRAELGEPQQNNVKTVIEAVLDFVKVI